MIGKREKGGKRGESGGKFEGPMMNGKDRDAPWIDKQDAPYGFKRHCWDFQKWEFYHMLHERV